MKIGFIGAGKVGFTLGKFFVDGNIHVTGYYSKHIESARQAATFTDTLAYDEFSMLIEDSDVIFITVPDGQILSVYNEMKDIGIEGKQLCHCSGVMTSGEAFHDIEQYGAYGYSIHPLFPVSSKYETYRNLPGAFFCLEGNEKYLDYWEHTLQNLGAKCRKIPAEKKVEYHAACVVASNLVCGLMAESLGMLRDCGFSQEEALAALKPLSLTNMDRVFEVGPADALTGPVERDDYTTVEKHLNCFSSKIDRDVYCAVTERLIDVAMEKHPMNRYLKMKEIIRRSKG